MVNPALACLAKTLKTSEDKRLAWNAATDILDRAGIGKPEKGNGLQAGEARLTVTYDAVQQLQQADPERWERIQRAAAGIAAEERQLPAGCQVVDVGGGK
jgi:hypothetical protein